MEIHSNKRILNIFMSFLSDIPSENLIKDLACVIDENNKNKSDKYNIIEREIYLFLPNGYGRTKLNNNFFEKIIKKINLNYLE